MMWLAGHEGKLYAGNGYGQDIPGGDPQPGPQVLRKDGPDAPWQVDLSFGPGYLRTELLVSLSLTTDDAGRPLEPPRAILVASPSTMTAAGSGNLVFVRDGRERWQASQVAPGTRGVRSLGTHRDRVTGVHYLFAGLNDGRIFRGAWDPAAPAGLRWAEKPERTVRTARSRVMSFAECNGELYMTARIDDDASGQPAEGGLYRRIDGLEPHWELVVRWPVDPQVPQSRYVRGLTAVPDPAGGGHEVLIANMEYPGLTVRFDPEAAADPSRARFETELDPRSFFDQAWHAPAGHRRGVIAAYNRFLPTRDPVSGETVWLCGAWAEYPGSPQAPYNGSVYLVRHRDGHYDWGYVYDAEHPVPSGARLTGTRDIEPSPFPTERGRVFYFAGYDGGAGPSHNTAWIYRGALPPRSCTALLHARNGSLATPESMGMRRRR